MTDNSHSGDDRFNVTEKPEPWSWNQRPDKKQVSQKRTFKTIRPRPSAKQAANEPAGSKEPAPIGTPDRIR